MRLVKHNKSVYLLLSKRNNKHGQKNCETTVTTQFWHLRGIWSNTISALTFLSWPFQLLQLFYQVTWDNIRRTKYRCRAFYMHWINNTQQWVRIEWNRTMLIHSIQTEMTWNKYIPSLNIDFICNPQKFQGIMTYPFCSDEDVLLLLLLLLLQLFRLAAAENDLQLFQLAAENDRMQWHSSHYTTTHILSYTIKLLCSYRAY